jgi:drug/metabolite transporter (DMT)-like permease
VPTSALLLALAAAFVHALWNLLLAGARDSEAATAVALAVAVLVFAPVAAVVRSVEEAAWPYIGGSAAFHLLYFGLLGTAYRRSELSLVYPLARGLAPVVVLIVGILALGAGASIAQAVGVCLVAAGVLLVRGLRGRRELRGVLFGLGIACCTAGYTLVDSEGVQHANPVSYLELALLLPAAAYATTIAALKGASAVRAALSGASLLAGLAMFGAYALVLAALQVGSAASVAAVRETSVVIATAAAAFFLGEHVGRERLLGAALVAGGVGLLTA